ncbi:hypothetical protein EDD15DRAFT_2198684 [Pisolithus albus]|nr:hypothetical protein EDD15DRAFT_2198684 [Pisolithus albus]
MAREQRNTTPSTSTSRHRTIVATPQTPPQPFDWDECFHANNKYRRLSVVKGTASSNKHENGMVRIFRTTHTATQASGHPQGRPACRNQDDPTMAKYFRKGLCKGKERTGGSTVGNGNAVARDYVGQAIAMCTYATEQAIEPSSGTFRVHVQRMAQPLSQREERTDSSLPLHSKLAQRGVVRACPLPAETTSRNSWGSGEYRSQADDSTLNDIYTLGIFVWSDRSIEKPRNLSIPISKPTIKKVIKKSDLNVIEQYHVARVDRLFFRLVTASARQGARSAPVFGVASEGRCQPLLDTVAPACGFQCDGRSISTERTKGHRIGAPSIRDEGKAE